MTYLVICLWLLGSVMSYLALEQESIDLGEKIAWTAFWPFMMSVGILLGFGVWLYEIITGNKVRF